MALKSQNYDRFFPSINITLGKAQSSSKLHQAEPTPLRSPAGKEIYHPSRHNPNQPYTAEIVFQRTPLISLWRKRWSTDSLFFLDMQHHSTTMICCFFRLSMMRIFPKVADQAKKATLKGALFR
jgi:hypothetical protein